MPFLGSYALVFVRTPVLSCLVLRSSSDSSSHRRRRLCLSLLLTTTTSTCTCHSIYDATTTVDMPKPARLAEPKPDQPQPAVSYNSKTGRPIRRSAGKTASPFVDSAVAISEDDSDHSDPEQDVTTDDEGIVVVKSRKRKRSPSPPMSEASMSDSEGDAMLSDYGNAATLRHRPAQSIETMVPTTPMAPIQLTLNVPAGAERQVVLNIDLNSYINQHLAVQTNTNNLLPSPKRAKTTGRYSKASSTSPSTRPTRAGFLDLPAELRNEVYRLAFVSPARFDFGVPNKNFQRSSAFLRTCRQVYDEGRSILYSENEFFFQRQSRRCGSIWAADWGELGFKPVRKFLKMIGPSNTSFIRHVTMLFEDAQPSLNPQMHNAEERRFVHDENLHSVLRHLATHGTLARFYMNFQGRKTLDVYYPNDHFLDLLTRVRADDVMFVKHPVWAPHSTYHSRSKQSNGVVQMCFEMMVRKKKLFLTQ